MDEETIIAVDQQPDVSAVSVESQPASKKRKYPKKKKKKTTEGKKLDFDFWLSLRKYK